MIATPKRGKRLVKLTGAADSAWPQSVPTRFRMNSPARRRSRVSLCRRRPAHAHQPRNPGPFGGPRHRTRVHSARALENSRSSTRNPVMPLLWLRPSYPQNRPAKVPDATQTASPSTSASSCDCASWRASGLRNLALVSTVRELSTANDNDIDFVRPHPARTTPPPIGTKCPAPIPAPQLKSYDKSRIFILLQKNPPSR